MNHVNDTMQDNGGSDADMQGGSEQRPPGHSGEGAASALAQLKTQTRQHRRLVGEGGDERPEGSAR